MDKLQILNIYDFYRQADATHQEEFERLGSSVALQSGEYFFHEGDECTRIALLGQGQIRVFMVSDAGREITLYHVRPGEACILSAACVLAGVQYPVTAIAEADIEAVSFPGPVFRKWVGEHETIRDFVFSTLAKRLANMLALVEEVTFKKLDRRLVTYLLDNFSNHGRPLRVLNLTHEQIASDLGSAREVVSRLLKELEQDGAIELARGRIVLTDEAALRRLHNDQ